MKRWTQALMVMLCLSGGLGIRARAQVTVKADFVPRIEADETVAPDPAKLGDVARVKADADSKAGIEKITFEVDDQFRYEAKTPPYVYDWDTLNENDGQHTLAVTAYNVNGQTGVKRIKVTVLNNLKLGIPHFVKTGLAAFARNDIPGLDKAARKAYKISRVDNDAARLMALDRGVKGDIGGGFQILDDQMIGIPKDEPFTLRVRGYLTLFGGVNEGDNVRMVERLEQGFGLVRKQAAGELVEVTKSYPEASEDAAGQMARGDALFAQHNYDAALAAYEKSAKLNTDRTEKRRAQHRVCMALLRLSRVAEAELFAARLNNSADADDTSRALLAAVLFQKRKYPEAKEMARVPAQGKNLVGLQVTALCDLVAGARVPALKAARDAVAIADMPETQYTLTAALADSGDRDGAKRAFKSAFLRDPLFSQTLIERAWETMTYDGDNERFAHALNLLDLILSAEPDNPGALSARIAALLQLGRYPTAQPLVARLAGQDPLAPDTALLKAITLARGDQSNAVIKPALDFAQKTDPVNYSYAFMPPIPTLIPRLIRLRRVVPLTPNLLDATAGLIVIPSD